MNDREKAMSVSIVVCVPCVLTATKVCVENVGGGGWRVNSAG